MALVRISRKLLDDVELVISNMQNTELNSSSGDGSPATPQELYAAAMEAAWVEAPQLQAVLPKSWGKYAEQLDVHICNEDGKKQYHWYRTISVKEVSANLTKFFLPHNFGSDYRPDIYVPPSIWNKYPTIANQTAYTSKQAELREGVLTKYNGVKMQVKTFLNSCKSLNDAVKKWEGVLLYIPSDYKRELDRVVERAPRTKQEKPVLDGEIDIDQLTTIGIMHKMGGV